MVIFRPPVAYLENFWVQMQKWYRALTKAEPFDLGREWKCRFPTITSQALHFAARLTKLDLSKEKHDQLMNGFLEMKAYPDVQAALQTLSDAGLRLGFLSNLTEAMMEANIQSAGLQGRFELLLSTDRVQAYKPDPRAYQMGIDAFRAAKTTDPIRRLSRMGRRRG
jgi:2-haloalkanoic acid dehalogenase type II